MTSSTVPTARFYLTRIGTNPQKNENLQKRAKKKENAVVFADGVYVYLICTDQNEEISRYLQGAVSFEEMRYTLLCRIRQFAKRQDIFFRKMEREGIPIRWLNEGDPLAAEELINRFLDGGELPEITFRMSETFYGKR